ncbi:hypothetical protein SDC9_73429 [bioreactor metagenome]|uniref:Uncharacterized protein n=1 Tax=bioreactor metagenome TaxID=1076179 RepID=A0A644YLD6_9ZZZZ
MAVLGFIVYSEYFLCLAVVYLNDSHGVNEYKAVMYHVRKLSFKTVFFKHSSHPSFNLFVNNITIFESGSGDIKVVSIM